MAGEVPGSIILVKDQIHLSTHVYTQSCAPSFPYELIEIFATQCPFASRSVQAGTILPVAFSL